MCRLRIFWLCTGNSISVNSAQRVGTFTLRGGITCRDVLSRLFISPFTGQTVVNEEPLSVRLSAGPFFVFEEHVCCIETAKWKSELNSLQNRYVTGLRADRTTWHPAGSLTWAQIFVDDASSVDALQRLEAVASTLERKADPRPVDSARIGLNRLEAFTCNIRRHQRLKSV